MAAVNNHGATHHAVGEKVNLHTLSAVLRELERDGKELPTELAEVVETREVFDIKGTKR